MARLDDGHWRNWGSVPGMGSRVLCLLHGVIFKGLWSFKMLVHYSPIDMVQHPQLDLQEEAALIEEFIEVGPIRNDPSWTFCNLSCLAFGCMHARMCELHTTNFYACWWCLANSFLKDGLYLHLGAIFAAMGHICTCGSYLHPWVIFACDAFNLWCLKVWQVVLFVFICMVFQWLYV